MVSAHMSNDPTRAVSFRSQAAYFELCLQHASGISFEYFEILLLVMATKKQSK